EAIFAAAKEVQNIGSDDLAVDSLAQILKTKTPILWDVRNSAEVNAALSLSKQFELPWVLVDPTEVDGLAELEVLNSPLCRGVILNPEVRPGQISNPSLPSSTAKKPTPVWQRAKQLLDAGAVIALHASSDANLDDLWYTSSILGRAGISKADILSMLTSNPARILGVSGQVGSLTEGRFADFVVLSGSPLEGQARVVGTYSGGKSVYNASTKPDGESKSYLIEAAAIYTPAGIVENASLGVADGKISGIGSGISARPDAIAKSFPGAVVVPGLIDCGVSVGTGSSLGDSVSFASKIGELLARDDRSVAMARQGGVTTGLLSSTRLPSPVMAFKLTDQPRVLKDPVALRYQIRGNLTAAEESMRKTLTAGKAYADSWTAYEAKLEEYKKQLKAYEEEKKKYDAAVKAAEDKKKAEEAKKKAEEAKKGTPSSGKPEEKNEDSKDEKPAPKPEEKKEDEAKKEESTKDSEKKDGEKPAAGKTDAKSDPEKPELKEPKKPTEPKKPRASSTSEPYRALFAGKLVAMVDVSDGKALEIVVKLFRKEFDLKTAVVAGAAAAENAKLLQENDIFVVVGPTLVGSKDGEVFNYPAELAVAGVDFGFQSRATTGVKELPDAISYSVYEGLGRKDAMQALTVSPVEFFGLENIGSLVEGGDADLVVLSGSPLDLATEVLAVMIDGQWVYEKDN
ncbi:MAG: amidohydrolase family protein, partial [Planctomycetota bacterium]